MIKKMIKIFSVLVFILLLSSCKQSVVKVTDVILPDLAEKDREQIVSLFKEKYPNVKLEIKENFNIKVQENIFLSYEDVKSGDKIKSNTKVVVNVSSFNLPDLTKYDSDDAHKYLLNSGVDSSDLYAQGAFDKGDPGKFVEYIDYKIGDKYQFGKKLKYIYNNLVELTDLKNKTKLEIKDYFTKKSINTNFSYETNNNLEMDTFIGYKDKKIGDFLKINTTVNIILAKDDTINLDKQLFISKIVNISDTTQGLELYNPLDSDINLNDYYISLYQNNSITPTETIDLEGEIKSKKTFLLVSQTSYSSIRRIADQVSNKYKIDFNNAVSLNKKSNKTYIDIINNIDNQITTLNEEIFVRRENITTGKREFNINEWAGYIPDYTEILGKHPIVVEKFPKFEKLDKTFSDGGMSKIKFVRSVDGDTIYAQNIDLDSGRDFGYSDGNKRIRFIMVDTPETQKPNAPAQPLANEAWDYTDKILEKATKNNTEIYIQANAGNIEDNYGRHLGLIWANTGTEQKPEWHLINYELLRLGLGEPASTSKDKDFKKSPVWGNRYMYQWATDAYDHARNNKLGIYAK